MVIGVALKIVMKGVLLVEVMENVWEGYVRLDINLVLVIVLNVIKYVKNVLEVVIIVLNVQILRGI